MRKNKVAVLTIAGSDSSGGAGIQADIKVISALGCYAASVITALTAQNTCGVQGVYGVSPEFVSQQLESVLSDLEIRAVKIGMLYNEKIIEAVSSALQTFQPPSVVLDPVMVSKNGYALMDPKAVSALQEMLFPYVTLITPNLLEAEWLLGKKIHHSVEQELAAIQLGKQFKTNVLLKGGHFSGHESSDILYLHQEALCHWFHTKRVHSQHTHGTGCSLSSAIAAYLAKGYSLQEAVDDAKHYLTQAIEFGATLQIGHGCGPIDHFYFLENLNDL